MCFFLGLLAPKNSIILPCLDLQESDLSRYFKLGADIYILKLKFDENKTLTPMLILDTFNHISTNLAALLMINQLQPPLPNTCKSPQYWGDSFKFVSKMINSSFLGKTGKVELDKFGRRSNFDLEVIQYKLGVRVLEGLWTHDEGLFQAR